MINTPLFTWSWYIDSVLYVTPQGAKVEKFIAEVTGVSNESGKEEVNFRTSAHYTADEAHKEMTDIIRRTEGLIFEQNQLYRTS